MIFQIVYIVALCCGILLIFEDRRKQYWAKVFEQGNTPKDFTNNGKPQEWRITMLTGPIVSMDFWPLRHRKRFPDNACGANILLKNCIWGFFQCKKLEFADGGVQHLDYSGIASNGLSSRIFDIVRTASDPNVMIGKFYYKLFGTYRFLGYFKMQKIEQ